MKGQVSGVGRQWCLSRFWLVDPDDRRIAGRLFSFCLCEAVGLVGNDYQRETDGQNEAGIEQKIHLEDRWLLVEGWLLFEVVVGHSLIPGKTIVRRFGHEATAGSEQ